MIISIPIVPTYGCDAITDDGTCFSYFTSTSRINWETARQRCLLWGYDLASVKNSQENSLLYATRSTSNSVNCWIGLNDRSSEGLYVWSDGSNSLYRNWRFGEPNNQENEDCVHFFNNVDWNDKSCTYTVSCFFCSSTGKNTLMILSRYKQEICVLIRIGVGSGRVGRAMALPKISPSPFKLRQNLRMALLILLSWSQGLTNPNLESTALIHNLPCTNISR